MTGIDEALGSKLLEEDERTISMMETSLTRLKAATTGTMDCSSILDELAMRIKPKPKWYQKLKEAIWTG